MLDKSDLSLAVEPFKLEKGRPFARCWSRFVDIWISALLFLTILLLLQPDITFDVASMLAYFLCIVFWVLPESILMLVFGTTPGKYLFNIKVEKLDGSQCGFIDWLCRSFKVAWRGLAMGLPLVIFYTLFRSGDRLDREGVTTWDRDGEFSVQHQRIGWVRKIVIALTLLLAVFSFFID